MTKTASEGLFVWTGQPWTRDCGHKATHPNTTSLWRSIRSLRRGMAMCQQCHAILKLATGKYVPRFTPVDIHEFGTSSASGWDLVNKSFVHFFRTSFVSSRTKLE